jgi:hypothetical protein
LALFSFGVTASLEYEGGLGKDIASDSGGRKRDDPTRPRLPGTVGFDVGLPVGEDVGDDVGLDVG